MKNRKLLVWLAMVSAPLSLAIISIVVPKVALILFLVGGVSFSNTTLLVLLLVILLVPQLTLTILL